MIEAIDSHWLPTSGGVGATIVVTMTHQQLLDDLETAGVCTLDTGGRISAAEARRLACRAGIIPLVLGSRSVVLDAGTKTRFHTEPMRIAMGVRDRGCTAQDCDVPASMCHAHHDTPFSQGGATSVANGRLLCGHHHRRIHDPKYRHDPPHRQGQVPPQVLSEDDVPRERTTCGHATQHSHGSLLCQEAAGRGVLGWLVTGPGSG